MSTTVTKPLERSTVRAWWVPGIILAALGVFGAFGDPFTTHYALSTGIAEEANSNAVWMFSAFGFLGWAGLTALATLFNAILVTLRPRNTLMWTLFAFCAGVCLFKAGVTVHNLMVIQSLG